MTFIEFLCSTSMWITAQIAGVKSRSLLVLTAVHMVYIFYDQETMFGVYYGFLILEIC